MLSFIQCCPADIVSVACLLVWKQPLCIRMSSILLLCTKKMPILLFSPADGSCQDTWEHGSDITVVSCGAECAGPAWARRHQRSCLFSIFCRKFPILLKVFFPQQMGPTKTPENMEAISQSYLVELSVLAPPGQDAIGEDMRLFAEQLRPLVQLEKVDYKRLPLPMGP